MKPSDLAAAARAFVEATKGDVVSTEEISKRARICKACPLRVRTSGVGRVSQILGNIANKNRLPSELKDYACSVCGCSMQLLLCAKNPHTDSEKERARRLKGNKNCWLLSE